MSRITEALKGAGSRTDAYNALSDLNPTRPALVEAARDLDIRSDGSKAEIAQRLVNGTAGSREDAAAIRNAPR